MSRAKGIRHFEIKDKVQPDRLAKDLGLVLSKENILYDQERKVVGVIIDIPPRKFLMANIAICKLCQKLDYLKEVSQKEAWGNSNKSA